MQCHQQITARTLGKTYQAVHPEDILVFLSALPPSSEAYESRQFELFAILNCRAWHLMIIFFNLIAIKYIIIQHTVSCR